MRLRVHLCASLAAFAVHSFLPALALFSTAAAAQTRTPPEVRHKQAYINQLPKPPQFNSAMLWGIAIADTRVPGYERAQIEIAETEFSCRVDGKNVVLNEDTGAVRGGLYRRYPWFGTDAHEPMPISYSEDQRKVILRVGTRPDRVWHFWTASPRAEIPPGTLDGCTVRARVRISPGALLQIGFDYWKNRRIDYGSGGNNHEAGASDWYLPSPDWQEAVFSDIAK